MEDNATAKTNALQAGQDNEQAQDAHESAAGALDILYRPGSPASAREPSARISARYADKLGENATLAARLSSIDEKAASRLLSCHAPVCPQFRCRLRWCSFCSLDRTRHLVRSYEARLDQLPYPHHITLTSLPEEVLLRSGLRCLKGRFKVLREHPRFIACVRGGVANFEIAIGRKGWLPHVHAVLDVGAGARLQVRWLREEWRRLGGGRRVKLQEIRAGEACRTFAYSSQGYDAPADTEHLREFYQAAHGFRFIEPWGSLHPLRSKILSIDRSQS